jgi:hypothetical protein
MEKMGPPIGRFGRAFTVLSFSIFESPFLIVMDGVPGRYQKVADGHRDLRYRRTDRAVRTFPS